MSIYKDITENECVNERHPSVKADNLTNIADNWKTVRDRIELILFTNMKSQTCFRLVSKLVTLNDTEQRNDRRRALSLR